MRANGRWSFLVGAATLTVLVAAGITPGLKPNFAAAAGLVDWPLVRSDQANSGYNAAESTLSATNVSQLKIAWSASVQLDPHATPILADGSLYVPCQGTGGSPSVCAIDAASGQLRWTTPVGSGELTRGSHWSKVADLCPRPLTQSG